MKYLPLYHEWAKKRRLPYRGLCSSLWAVESSELLHEFEPENGDGSYWGHELGAEYERLFYPIEMQAKVRFEFSPLRQNIVLFMAAMNNEL